MMIAGPQLAAPAGGPGPTEPAGRTVGPAPPGVGRATGAGPGTPAVRPARTHHDHPSRHGRRGAGPAWYLIKNCKFVIQVFYGVTVIVTEWQPRCGTRTGPGLVTPVTVPPGLGPGRPGGTVTVIIIESSVRCGRYVTWTPSRTPPPAAAPPGQAARTDSVTSRVTRRHGDRRPGVRRRDARRAGTVPAGGPPDRLGGPLAPRRPRPRRRRSQSDDMIAG